MRKAFLLAAVLGRDLASLARKYHYLSAAVFFVSFVALLHKEVLLDMSGLVLAGQQVGGFFSWLFWWWSYAVQNGLPLFHTGLLMYPAGVPVFFHSPVNELSAVLLQLFTTPYAAYNLLTLACYVLTGLSAYLLFYRLTRSAVASLCGAFCYAFSSYMVVQHYHGQVIEATLYFNPLLALALISYREKADLRGAFLVAAALAGVFLSGPYVAFSFGAVFLAGALLYDAFWGGRRLFNARALLQLAGAAAAAGAVALVFYWPLLKYSGRWVGGSQFYSASLLSFIDLPFWHSGQFAQRLRFFEGVNVPPEMIMSYLGAGTLALGAYGIWKGLHKESGFAFWLWLFGFSAVLTLGPWLKLSPESQTWVPLPYLLLKSLPVVSSFRNSSRILMTVTLAASAIAALSLSELLRGRSRAWRLAAGAVFLAAVFFEFDLAVIGKRYASSAPSPVYEVLRRDAGAGAVLELPAVYDREGNLLIRMQSYMLFQPYHRRPLVLGYPSRHLLSSLEFTEKTEGVYELTHPWVLAGLNSKPALKARKAWLAAHSARLLREAGIKYVVYHPERVLGEELHRDLEKWLPETLGRPLLTDGAGNQLFVTGGGS
ncbi:MAG TPA: hypothetical protein DEQ38_00760 [Elusimicrobia bacterium]|nr:MAG: hypothetical protein A2089_09795 [Elusimicrobia bacterium GWD2_63_28]HCC46642.1 hypothetical protein [Elusimicrobiota bacterium]